MIKLIKLNLKLGYTYTYTFIAYYHSLEKFYNFILQKKGQKSKKNYK